MSTYQEPTVRQLERARRRAAQELNIDLADLDEEGIDAHAIALALEIENVIEADADAAITAWDGARD